MWNNILKFFQCLGFCLSQIPWWAWLILVIGGIICGIVNLMLTALVAGTTLSSIVFIAWIVAGVKGALAAIAVTFGICALGCVKEIQG
jgi:hypothetical protein